MVKTFSETWDEIENILKASAALLGIDASMIKKGDRETPQRAPFLTVYLLPSEFKQSEVSSALAPRATCLVFCGVKPAKTLAESIIEGVNIATKVMRLIESIPEAMFRNNPIEFDEDSTIFTAVSVQFSIRYKLL